MKPLPDIQYLDECFDYDGETGSFTWKERPRHHFATDRGRKITNTSCAGTVAGERCKNGSRVVALGGVHLTVHRICFFLSCGFDGAEAVIPLNGDYADLRAANLGIHGGEKLQSLEARTGAGGRGSTRTYLPLPSLAYLNECFDYCEDTGRLTWKVRPAAHFTARKTWIMWNTRWPGKAAGSNVRGYLKVRLSGTEYQAQPHSLFHASRHRPRREAS